MAIVRMTKNIAVDPTRKRQTMRHSTWRYQRIARQPLAAIWMTPNRTIAGATSMKSNSSPSRSMPPAMPKMPEMNDVTTTAIATTANRWGASIG
jgi:hypothetical protein